MSKFGAPGPEDAQHVLPPVHQPVNPHRQCLLTTQGRGAGAPKAKAKVKAAAKSKAKVNRKGTAKPKAAAKAVGGGLNGFSRPAFFQPVGTFLRAPPKKSRGL